IISWGWIMHNTGIVPRESKDYLNSWSFIIELFNTLKALKMKEFQLNKDNSIDISFYGQIKKDKGFYQTIKSLEAILDTKLGIEYVKPDLVRLSPLSVNNFFLLQMFYN
ncbi:MAG: hypothetical protein ACFFD4_28315, partial [Candidatus Odinarchaeota archaeon]